MNLAPEKEKQPQTGRRNEFEIGTVKIDFTGAAEVIFQEFVFENFRAGGIHPAVQYVCDFAAFTQF